MTLKSGVRIGPYEIESLVGDSGLGDVWKARDLESGRPTALRMLPTAPPDDPDRFARFDRDIRVLASLNHPSIATVDGIVEVGDARALAVAWVDGPSLAERLKDGTLPIDEVLVIAVQVADAIGAAHDRAIVHGNLQPCNIKIGSDHSVRVLDLGMNTLLEREVPHVSGVFPSPLARAVSVIIGTAAYMSPEQVRGAQADARSDVWAFGCVMFEMLTGRPAFGATDTTETCALILGEEPEWAWIPASTPPALVSMLKTCLRKDVGARRQDLSGMSVELQYPEQSSPQVAAYIRPALEALAPPSEPREWGDVDDTVERETRLLKRWIRGRVPPDLDINEDDIVRDVVMSAMSAIRRVPDRGPFRHRPMRAYLRQAAKNRILDEMRRRRRTPRDEDEEGFPPDVPEIGPEYDAALAQLTDRDRELLVARLRREMSYDEIATHFSLPSRDAARVSVMRAIKRFIEKLKERWRK